MGEVLIKAENVSKKFAKDLKRSLYYGVKDVFSKMRNAEKNNALRKTEFWAVRDVSFEIRRGECLGLIGHNGAGKSTLLKMLNGLIKPDKGSITMHGKVGALIELGAGFNPILTGRENIYNNASVLGFSKDEVDKKFDSIVEFSEIGEFLDMPVQNYSSGMKVRLGFAVAAQMEPDILLIDEVLAVGDLGFRIKCLNRISELLNKTAVIFVSHSMPQIARICNAGIMFNSGKIHLKTNDVGKLIEEYYLHFETKYDSNEINPFAIQLFDCRVNDMDPSDELLTITKENKYLKVEFKFDCPEEIDTFSVHFPLTDAQMIHIAITTSLYNIGISHNMRKRVKVSALIPNVFSNGRYYLGITIVETTNRNNHYNLGRILYKKEGFAQFLITETPITTSVPILLDSNFTIDYE